MRPQSSPRTLRNIRYLCAMQRVLFHSTVFGPIRSRRLGASLGVNLSPNDGKVCSFDCLYCEAGYNAQGPGTTGLPARADVSRLLGERLAALHAAGDPLDVITFSGNGEPTLHPDFAAIIDDTIAVRDRFYPEAKISVLSNSTQLRRPDVIEALRRVDNNIVKLDSAVEATMRALDRPTSPAFTVGRAIDDLCQFGGDCIIQTMQTRGFHNGVRVDNTTPAERAALLEAYRRIRPREVMLYGIDRKTPEESLEKVGREELQAFADMITRELAITVQTV